MTPEAAKRKLFAKPAGNGVTGFVAHSKKSYLCQDTATDKLYIRGAMGARSSMTVPLIYNDEVVGTLNVESPRPNAFSDEDLQFTELFSREIAAALHQLDLLQAQRDCAATASIEAVNKEIALPVDDILTAAATLYARLHGTDADAGANLRKVMAAARMIKECVRKVGVEITPAEVPAPGNTTTPTVPEVPVEHKPLQGRNVLLVDSDERLRRQAHLVLGRLGAHVETARNATEGLALSMETPYDCVIMDIRPPDMGGYEAYKCYRATLPNAQVCMMTDFGYDVAHSIVKARQDGMQFVIFKPTFNEDMLIKAVLTPVSHPHSQSCG
jgi:CheY-like chemotaxis protein